MEESLLRHLPFELIEAICDAPELSIERHHVRSLLRACCVELSNLKPAPTKHYHSYRRALVWLQNGADIGFIRQKRLCSDGMIMHLIAVTGRLDLMKMHRYPWNQVTSSLAAKHGHLDCLQYAHKNGCPWNEHICIEAAKNGHLDCLQYAHENGCPWDEHTCIEAAKNGHLDCLQYAHENGASWSEEIYQTKHSDCLRYVLEHSCQKS